MALIICMNILNIWSIMIIRVASYQQIQTAQGGGGGKTRRNTTFDS